MGKIALVSLGGAGTAIMREIIRLSEKDYDMFNVNSRKVLEGPKFYGFEEIEVLADELKDYECVVMTAGLGSTGGDALVKLQSCLKDVRKVCFVVSPFYFEIDRLMRSRSQISQILTGSFEGAVVGLNSILSGELEENADTRKALEEAIKKFDREMASMILDMMMELE
ncbi:hypothetical protein [Archaeoglobus neptunius]|uniref:hypothetical protein n=1 Tax=Archaeoglobus neptunius TaxID=2798580 RepID=UPI001928E915|nr:hypothetical protein [Archaeoglobus neptunius]